MHNFNLVFPPNTTACSDLAAPLYGSVTVDGTTTGSTASYSCDDGYELVGDVMRVCMSDSEWSGTPPVCLRKSCTMVNA